MSVKSSICSTLKSRQIQNSGGRPLYWYDKRRLRRVFGHPHPVRFLQFLEKNGFAYIFETFHDDDIHLFVDLLTSDVHPNPYLALDEVEEALHFIFAKGNLKWSDWKTIYEEKSNRVHGRALEARYLEFGSRMEKEFQ